MEGEALYYITLITILMLAWPGVILLSHVLWAGPYVNLYLVTLYLLQISRIQGQAYRERPL